jgi:neutral ceramidase
MKCCYHRLSYLAARMAIKKILRGILISVLSILLLLAIFLAFSVGRIDRSPASDHESYEVMMNQLEKLDSVKVPIAGQVFNTGYAKVNITPATPTATAGYGNRKGKLFTSVRDSIYVRAIVVNNGTQKVAIVSADLLIIPPEVVADLEAKLPSVGFSLENTYLGATHTHNSIGNWGRGATRFIYGGYKDAIVGFIADKIVECIRLAGENIKPSVIKAGIIPVPQAVGNRLIKGGPVDSLLRVIEINRNDSSKLLLMSYTAHATCLYSKDLTLSRDYPGKLVDTLESKGYTFAMFMAGAVGSHTCAAPESGPDCIEWMAEEVSNTFLSNRNLLAAMKDTSLLMLRVPLSLGDPQVKITPEWKVRAWLFRFALGEYPVYLTALRLGDVVMLGTPCDFSGEFSNRLDSFAAQKNLTALVTSFNGGYIGYITPISRYDVDHYETQLMNWYAPGTGEYIETCLEKLLTVVDD